MGREPLNRPNVVPLWMAPRQAAPSTVFRWNRDEYLTTEGTRFSRRNLLKNAMSIASAAAMVGTTLTTADAANLPKTAVGYQDSPHGNRSCSSCAQPLDIKGLSAAAI